MLKNKCPILLAHGIARFDILQQMISQAIPDLSAAFDDRFHYFRGIKTFLESESFDVRHTSVDFAGSVQKRAGELAAQVESLLQASGKSKVHIVAHSMGGLDARFMIVNVPGMENKVASLTTIGTPHHGTAFADHGLRFGGKLLIEALRPVAHLEGFADLTTAACAAFNARAMEGEAANSVVYQTYSSSQERNAVFLPLRLSWEVIERAEGANDGLVSVTSQAWASKLAGKNTTKAVAQKRFAFPADHLNEVGWWDPNEFRLDRAFDAKASIEAFEAQVKRVYLEIAESVLKHES